MTLTVRNRAASLGIIGAHAVLLALVMSVTHHQLAAGVGEIGAMVPLTITFVIAAAFGGVLATRADRSRLKGVRPWLLPFGVGLAAAATTSLLFPQAGLEDPLTILVALAAGVAVVLVSQYLLVNGMGRLLRPAAPQWSVLVVGSNRRTEKLILRWLRQSMNCVEVVGYVDVLDDVDPERRNPRQDRWPFLGSVDELAELTGRNIIDEVWITLPVKSYYDEIQKVLATCETIGIPVRMPADTFAVQKGRTRLMAGNDLDTICYLTTHGRPWQLLVKRLIDIGASGFLILLLSPLMLLCALAVKLTSRGPVLYSQVRCGLHGRTFKIYKFRSMVADADARRDELKDRNEVSGPVFKVRRDPRMTWVGRFMRKTSLDELPQLFNILRGEMSLVGPRPPVPAEVAQYEPWQRRRLSVLPGLTCIWQVAGRSNIPFEQWMHMDLRYVDEWSLGRDLSLLCKTLPAVITMKGAH